MEATSENKTQEKKEEEMAEIPQDEEHLPTIVEGFWQLAVVAVPIFCQQALRYLQIVCNYAFVSYIDDPDVLGGLSLALCFYAILLQSSLFGLNSSITITVPQLIGLGKIKDTGRVLNAGRIVNTAITVPLMLILIFSNRILLKLGQGEEVSFQASRFLIGLAPCVWFFAQGNLSMYFLNSFKRTKPGLISSIAGLTIQIMFNCIFYLALHMGLMSGGISASLQNVCQFVFLFCTLYYYPEVKQALFWPKFNMKQWRYVKEYLWVGIPSLIMSSLYILGVEIMQPLAGNISSLCNGAQGIVMNLYYGIFTIYIGVSMATSIFVGSSMGKGHVAQARIYSKIAMLLILFITAILITLIMLFKDIIVTFYTSNEEIQKMASNALWIFCLAIIPDSILFVQAGILRGMGKQTIIIVIQVLFTAGVSVPLGCYFAFTLKMSIVGLWLGYLIRSVVTILVSQYIVWYHFSWEQIAQDIKCQQEKLSAKRLKEVSSFVSYGSILTTKLKD